jgi:hypothetical protein
MNDGGSGWFGILANIDGTTFDNSDSTAYGKTFFYAAGSQNTITIVPEPATMVLFAIAGALGLKRRNYNK